MSCQAYLTERIQADSRALSDESLRALANMCDRTQADCGAARRSAIESACVSELKILQASLDHCVGSLSGLAPCLGCARRDCTGKFLGVQMPLEAAEVLMAVAHRLEDLALRMVSHLPETHDQLDRAVTGH